MRLFKRSEFFNNAVTLITGTTIAQALPIALSPILTRLYTPSEFGVLALFVSITTIFGAAANARYEVAIVIPKEEKEALALLVLSFCIAFGLSIFLFAVVVLFHDLIVRLLGSDELSTWLYLAPLSVLFIGVFNALNFYNTRNKNFKTIAQANVFKSSAMVFFQLTLGLLKLGTSGLIIGQVSSHLSGNLKLARSALEKKGMIKGLTGGDIRDAAKRYQNFPKISLWGILANTLSQNLTNLVTSILFSIKTLGFYSLAQRSLGAPSILVGTSFGQIYMQEAAIQRNKYNNAKSIFFRTLKRLFIISLPIFSILFFIVEDVFAFVFGEEWRVAGQYAKIMMPLFWIRFIATPLSLTNIVFEKQKLALAWQIGLLLLSFIVYGFVYYYSFPIEFFLYLYTAVLFVYYLFLILIVKQVAIGKL